MEKDVIVYSAIFDQKDNLKELKSKSNRCQYICFTDNKNIKSDFWDIIHVNKPFESPRLCARYYKLNPHKVLNENFKKSVWIDANIDFISNFDIFIENYIDNIKYPFFIKHFDRNCVYDEIDKCIEIKKDNKDKLLKIKDYYKYIGFPENNGLYDTGVLPVNHNFYYIYEKWWDELYNNSIRDQVSLPYILWKNGFNCGEIENKNLIKRKRHLKNI